MSKTRILEMTAPNDWRMKYCANRGREIKPDQGTEINDRFYCLLQGLRVGVQGREGKGRFCE